MVIETHSRVNFVYQNAARRWICSICESEGRVGKNGVRKGNWSSDTTTTRVLEHAREEHPGVPLTQRVGEGHRQLSCTPHTIAHAPV